jgi:hypothetical protein
MPEFSDGGFVVKDSGERAEFDSGMVRDTTEGKLDYRIINYGPMKQRWIDHLNAARVKYPDVTRGTPNWTVANGIAEFDRFLESAERHFDIWAEARRQELTRWGVTGKFQSFPTAEDEAAAVFFNINGAEFVRAKVEHSYVSVKGLMGMDRFVKCPAEPQNSGWPVSEPKPYTFPGPADKPGKAYH